MSSKTRRDRTPLWSRKTRAGVSARDRVANTSVNAAFAPKRKMLSPSQPHSKTYGR